MSAPSAATTATAATTTTTTKQSAVSLDMIPLIMVEQQSFSEIEILTVRVLGQCGERCTNIAETRLVLDIKCDSMSRYIVILILHKAICIFVDCTSIQPRTSPPCGGLDGMTWLVSGWSQTNKVMILDLLRDVNPCLYQMKKTYVGSGANLISRHLSITSFSGSS